MNLCLFDPGIEDNDGAVSTNLGDLIIQAAVNRELRKLFPDAQPFQISTHAPMRPGFFPKLQSADYRFVGGTNLLSARMREYKQWEITFGDAWKIRKAILLGVGWWQYQKKCDWYTRFVLHAALSWTHTHSVRDEYTRKKLSSIGLRKVLNTGCPTMWPFLDFDFSKVPTQKAEAALVMLTDYLPNPETDRKLLELVTCSYKTVFFWPQGARDLEYVRGFNIPMRILDHSMGAVNELLESGLNFDCIGTRLHGGVNCLLSGKRTVVLEVDNRSREIARDTGFPTLARDDFDGMKRWINGSAAIQIRMNRKAIEQWREQFRKKDEL